jgi:hypothetical protein
MNREDTDMSDGIVDDKEKYVCVMFGSPDEGLVPKSN